MAESIRLKFSYDTSVKELYDVYISKDYYEKRTKNSSHNARFTRFEEENGFWHIHMARDMELRKDKVPAVMRKLLPGSSVTLETHFSWKMEANVASGDYAIHTPQMPIKSGGKMHIIEKGEQACEHIIELTVSCSVPLIGKKIARFLLEKAESGLRKDHQKTLAYLQERAQA